MDVREQSELRFATDGFGDGLHDPPSPEADTGVIQAALEQVLSSPLFIKSHRMSRLFRFIVENTLGSRNGRLKEYQIGLEVFDRDAKCYTPGEDPIVRVQMRRLREKLQQYYQLGGDDTGIRFDIPVGSYTPVIHRTQSYFIPGSRLRCATPLRQLLVLPLQSIGDDAYSRQFADGLREELLHHLLEHIGPLVMLRPVNRTPDIPNVISPVSPLQPAYHLLEGSVRYDTSRIRVNIRLLDSEDNSLKWSAQFDQDGMATLFAQEMLAVNICKTLKPYLMELMASPPAANRQFHVNTCKYQRAPLGAD